jgi:predicted MPP superfamily phosphohydrolase
VSLFLLILLLLFLLNILWWWQADSLLRRRHRSWRFRVWPLLLAVGMMGLLAAFFLSRGSDIPVRDQLPQPLVAALYIWHLTILPIWLFLSPAIGWAGFLQARRNRKRKTACGPESPVGWGRRNFLAYSVAAGPMALLLGTTTASIPQLRQFRIRHLSIPIPWLPPALDGVTIAQVSDVHVGPFTSGEILQRIVRATNELDADLVLMTGDLINDTLDDLPEAIAMVQALKARHGVFMCEGNHDLIPGPHEFERRTKAAGIQLLVNEQRTLTIHDELIQILGLRWGSGRVGVSHYGEDAISSSLQELLGQRNSAAFPILLAHHPHALDPAAQAGLPLVLAGHTHGGQLMLNPDLGFGPAFFRYWTGLYRQQSTTLAVSNGVGNWFPLRTAAPAEILHLTLRRADV